MNEFDQTMFSLFQIGISIHHLNKVSEKRMGLSLVQWCLLKHLIDMPGASAQSLAKAVGVHPSTLSQTLKRLEKKKLIFTTEDPTDSRKKLISITRLGKNTLSEVTAKMGDLAKDLASMGGELEQVCLHLRDRTGKNLNSLLQ